MEEKRFYSEATGCTYIPAIHGDKMPEDVILITAQVYERVIANPDPGKIRSHVDGLPVLIDPPPASAEDLTELERQWRDGELMAVTWLRDRHRDQLDAGTPTTLSTEHFAELLAYLQALRDWPQSTAFPDPTQRPTAPEWIAEHNQ